MKTKCNRTIEAGKAGSPLFAADRPGDGGHGTTDGGQKVALRWNQSGNVAVKVLEITGGSDVAEPFPMSDEAIPKGVLVVIDDERPGQLKLSREPYDTRVAGIVSGANGVNPGLTLRQEGKLDAGQNVVLTGRVYALADASSAPIQPGDLLTSSSTPGRVMKVTDHTRAQGAVVGNPCGLPQDVTDMMNQWGLQTSDLPLNPFEWGIRNSTPQQFCLDLPPPGFPLPPGLQPIRFCSSLFCLGGPYKTPGEGVQRAGSGDQLVIKAANYDERPRIIKRLVLSAEGGSVFIGKP